MRSFPVDVKLAKIAEKHNAKYKTNFTGREWLYNQYYTERIPATKIARRLNVSATSIYFRLENGKNRGIAWHGMYETIKNQGETEREAYARIWKEKGTLLSLCDYLGVEYLSLRLKFYEMGLLGRHLGRRRGSVAERMLKMSSKELISATIPDLVKRFGCCYQTAQMNRAFILRHRNWKEKCMKDLVANGPKPGAC